MSRRQARLEREAQRKLKAAEKSARLRERPVEEKTVRFGADPGSIFHMQMTWTVDQADCDGAWASGTPRQWSEECWANEIEPKLGEFAALTWAEIDTFTTSSGHKMHHSMDTSQIANEAQARLAELSRSEESIFRFRLGGKPRLWGFRVVSTFNVLWHDPEHEVYPVDVD
ncbi:hypothetical protein GCM10009116_19720 [Brevundimonas basaltis]|uniref:Uncharacterized protein n=1 Tax=Brevundimonas basaltis TaxID=472166 RepID=A0A7W8HXP6_9CAUL|nr:hypothetical protein [Brevundimonas basaltis]MBB5291725.1 hypothetical protein [Brevundimonas basaltis]